MYTIVVSKKNTADLNIKQRLLENFSFKETEKSFDNEPIYSFKDFELLTIDKEPLNADHLALHNSDFFIFASRHSSKAGIPALTCHPIGCWGQGTLGGKTKKLVKSSAFLLRNYFLSLLEKKEKFSLKDYEIETETTHHGPYLDTPCIFVELGSEEKSWKNEKGALAIAETIMEATSLESDAEPVIGLGGTHYAIEFSKLVQRKNFAFSHICPKHSLHELTPEMLQQAFDKSVEKPKRVIIDHKGMGKEKQRIIEMLNNQSIEFEKLRKLL